MIIITGGYRGGGREDLVFGTNGHVMSAAAEPSPCLAQACVSPGDSTSEAITLGGAADIDSQRGKGQPRRCAGSLIVFAGRTVDVPCDGNAGTVSRGSRSWNPLLRWWRTLHARYAPATGPQFVPMANAYPWT